MALIPLIRTVKLDISTLLELTEGDNFLLYSSACSGHFSTQESLDETGGHDQGRSTKRASESPARCCPSPQGLCFRTVESAETRNRERGENVSNL